MFEQLYIKRQIFSIDNMVTKVSLVIAHWGRDAKVRAATTAFPLPYQGFEELAAVSRDNTR